MDGNSPQVEPQSEDKVTVMLPANLLAQIDAQVGSAFVDRDDFMRAAVRYYLEHIHESQSAPPSDIG
jgi:Arc/MetJ-type ribon-helix-helix transcriptional regulator